MIDREGYVVDDALFEVEAVRCGAFEEVCRLTLYATLKYARTSAMTSISSSYSATGFSLPRTSDTERPAIPNCASVARRSASCCERSTAAVGAGTTAVGVRGTGSCEGPAVWAEGVAGGPNVKGADFCRDW